MQLERLQDLSMLEHVKNMFASEPSINVVDEYPEGELVLPTVVVDDEEIYITPYEMGNKTGMRIRLWGINVFGSNKAQRDDMVSTIINNIELAISVYDYNEGFPPQASPTQIGYLSIIDDSITVKTMRVFPDLVEKLYWRSKVEFVTEYNSV